MPTVDVYNVDGKVVGTMDLSEKVFDVEVNKSVMHEVVVNYLANQRQGTQSTLTRTEVRGGGIKPWRQKGTGRARQGSIRAPQWVGGGVAIGPKPRDYSYRVNKKTRQLALKSALSSKVQESELIVLEGLDVNEYKTKAIANILSNLNVTEKALIVLPENNKMIVNSARNIRGVDTTFVGAINTYEVLNHTKCIILKDAVTKLEEVYA
ncbi:MAG TPA: 50S ribosomal protein L4 [Candidatus Monoglobus merdigallinarum]|uniref:Large ribosomal subunit protein uL4 n=1 Tax=Candidatus Monoglobus merdigallinarum TaxID=2838698 RepID=A0A9D1PQU3_9FIRM|nr:50S ribosomal protein L4 [Candidatus Monoglobus merdigallinarum]